MSVDLDRFAGLAEVQDAGLDVEIMDPSGAPLGWTIRMAGPDSERARVIQGRITNDRVKRRNNAPPSDAEIEAETVRALAEMTISWTPVILFGGDFPCTVENARKLYEARHLSFVREQVNIAAGNRDGFFQKLQTSSAKPSA